ncbi:MAG: hypothetical protein AAFQ71_15415 [Planctomycetota bacterium]
MADTDSDTPDLDQAIAENAAGPAKAMVDGQSVEQHPLPDVIEVPVPRVQEGVAEARDRDPACQAGAPGC